MAALLPQHIVDDTDSRIIYEPKYTWITEMGNSRDYSLTSHSTSTASSWAFITFHGSQISVYGTLNHTSGVSSYALDKKSFLSIHTPRPEEIGHVTLLYQSPSLPNSEHTLNITLTESGKTLSLDCFNITADSNTTEVSQPSLNSYAPPSTSTAHAGPLSSGAIAGIAIAAMFFLLGFVALVATIYKIRWHNRHRTPSTGKEFDLLGTEVRPARRRPGWNMIGLPKGPASGSGAPTTAVFSSIISVTPGTQSDYLSMPDTSHSSSRGRR